MRLERLEIAGFGRLRGLAVDLSPRMTVILGDNESGKSTIHRAIRAALYGLDAGGQGRAVERSAWQRWMPWTPGPYGLVLTYSLADGRTFRVARRLDRREQPVQVQEVSGADVTAAMRTGRSVAPGQVHLGIDESVFCATAWLGDDGLLASPVHGIGQRAVATRLQEAMERLVDTGREVTAVAALGRLRDAMARIGSERRSGTPLGVATTRLRQLDGEIAAAQRRVAMIADERRRLDELERACAEAEHVSARCERAWLLGRVAGIAAERAELAAATAEAEGLERELELTGPHAGFPIEGEARVIALAGELHQTTLAAAEATARATAAEAPLHAVRDRRIEIAAGQRALGTPISLEDPGLGEASALGEALAAEGGIGRRLEELHRADAGAEQLRRQIAATGLAGIPPGDIEGLGPIFERALEPIARPAIAMAAAIMAFAGALGLAAAMSGRPSLGLLTLAAGTVLSAAALVASAMGDESRRARRHLGRRCPGLELTDEGLDIAASRLSTLRRLHDEVRRLDVLREAGRQDVEAARTRIAAIAQSCTAIADRLGVAMTARGRGIGEPGSVEAHAAAARAALAAIGEAVERRRCWDELAREDALLAREETTLAAVLEEALKRRAQADDIEDRLLGMTAAAGIPADLEPTAAVAAFRSACEGRRRHEEASARLAEVRRRIAAIGADDEALARREETFLRELGGRGVEATSIDHAERLSRGQLEALESQVTRAREVAASTASEARTLRARLGGALEGLPNLLALADERASCAAARERALHQLAALERAADLIEAAARSVHRDLAPRLAESVGHRISLLTDGRYREVNVDTEHLAVSLVSCERCELVPLGLASRGTRDQVSLLLRLALSELLSDAGEPVPVLLDEPLLSTDLHRTGHALEFLAGLSATHQVVMTTGDTRIAELMGDRMGLECAVVSLPAVSRPDVRSREMPSAILR